MPWTTMQDVPDSIAKHKGAILTIEQANKWAAIYDALKGNENIASPAGAAWSTWEEIFELSDGKWVARKREKSEAMLLIEEMATVEAVTEEEDGLPSKAKIVIIAAGPCKTKNRSYSREALQAAVTEGVFDSLQMFDAHPPGSEKIEGASMAPRKVAELMSVVIPGTVRFDEGVINPVTKKPAGGVVAEAELLDDNFRKNFKRKSKIIGPSLNSLCEAVKRAGEEIVTRIRKTISADWVTKPNAGGMVLQLVEAQEEGGQSADNGRKEESSMPVLEKWSDLTLDMLKANRADIVKQAAESMASDQAWLRQTAESLIAQAVQAAKAEIATAKSEAETAKQAQTAAEEKVKEFSENEAKASEAASTAKLYAMVEEKGKDRNVLARSATLQSLIGKKFADEKEMAEAVDAELAKIEKPKAEHQSSAKADEKPLPEGSKAFAEQIGLSPEEQKGIAAVRP